MSIKPFSQKVEQNRPQQKEKLKPFVAEAKGGVEVQEPSLELQTKQLEEKRNFLQKSIGFLGSLSGIIVTVIIFLFIAITVDALQNLESLYQSKSLLDMFYLLGLSLLMLSLGLFSYKNYKEIKALKNAKKMQDFYALQKENPNKKIISMTRKLLDRYAKNYTDEKILTKIEVLQNSINNSHDYHAIYKDLDKEVLSIIDTKAKEKIKNAAIQAAISTAISPLALLDAMIIIWRSFLLTKEIALLYGYKPNAYSTIILLKRGAFNVFFAGATELAQEYANETMHNSLIAKVSSSASQGMLNGVLMARLGYGVLRACRPLALATKRESFMSSIYNALKNKLLKND
ncbi:TIGR01620 family protein [Sulfurimonas sp.]|uniref:TIGR01620 family protein n=1 Tax=Sulfurimonas sp. TaxID=2022749 RepID=UPI00261F4227|nr:TIGR01620 family protein [Sulfurimonas sp.]